MDFYCNRGGPRQDASLKPVDAYDFESLYYGRTELATPLKVKIAKGKRFYEALYFYSDPINLAISDKLKNEFQEKGVSGWKTYDLKIVDCDLLYHGLIPTGRCGPLLRKHKGEIHGLEFDLQTWDGSDIFVPSDTYQLIFTHKVKEILERNKVNNFKIWNTRDVVWYNSL